DAIAVIRSVQPFDPGFNGNREDHPLWLLNELENSDKHRLVHVLPLTPTGATLSFDPDHVIPEKNVEMFDLSDRVLQDGIQVARIRVHRHPKMERNSALSMHVMIEETLKAPRLPWGVLDAMRRSVDDVIRALTPFIAWPPP